MKKELIQKCVEWVGEDRKPKSVQIGCPYGKEGCLVLHTEDRLSTEDKVINRTLRDMRNRMPELMEMVIGEVVKELKNNIDKKYFDEYQYEAIEDIINKLKQ